MTAHHTPEVVVVGGGIAALELVLALRELAGDRVGVTVVAPDTDLLLRPLLIAEPLGQLPPHPYPWPAIAGDLGVRFVRSSITAVDPERRVVVRRTGGTLPYDTLVLAPGARRLEAFDDTIHIGDPAGALALERLRDEIAAGTVRDVAFIAPTLTGWLLPLYEAALITARLGASATLITAEEEPLALFGRTAIDAVWRELDAAGVRFVGDARAHVDEGAVTVGDRRIDADRIIALPLVRGPRIDGVPEAGIYGLIPVGPYGRVAGLADAYAIGDATDYAIKQGGIACQQAASAASHIARRHGAPVELIPFQPRLRATLLTGAEPIALGVGADVPAKLPGPRLAPYLAAFAPTPA
jgi:sulfide:quinone oxidoreductase